MACNPLCVLVSSDIDVSTHTPPSWLFFFFFSDVSLCTIITPALCVHSSFKSFKSFTDTHCECQWVRTSISSAWACFQYSLLLDSDYPAGSGFSQPLTESWSGPGGGGEGGVMERKGWTLPACSCAPILTSSSLCFLRSNRKSKRLSKTTFKITNLDI